MRFRSIATDYDGTLASGGKVARETVAALARLRGEGVTLVLVTGRELEDLQGVFPELEVFDLVVAENGALLYRPSSGEVEALAEPPPEIFLRRLRDRAVEFSAGRVIVATTRRYEAAVREEIDQSAPDRVVIFNKDAVMVLPRGVNKGSGLQAALGVTGVAWAQTMGVGDAENDLDFLSRCGCAVATGNALQAVREAADYIAAGENGAGVQEAIALLRRLNRG